MMFNPLTDEQIDALESLTDGFADFRVTQALEKTSKNGNPMIELKLTVTTEHGGSGMVYDYLVMGTNKKFPEFKLKRFFQSIGHESQYKKGEIWATGLTGLEGKCLLKQKKDSQYFGVEEYIASAKANSIVQNPLPVTVKFDPENDDVPF